MSESTDEQYDDDDYEDDFGSDGEDSNDSGDDEQLDEDKQDDDARTSTCRAPDNSSQDDLQLPLNGPQTEEGDASVPSSAAAPEVEPAIVIPSRTSFPAPTPESTSPAPSATTSTTAATTTRTTSSPSSTVQQQKMMDTSAKLVKSEEKNLSLGLKLERTNEELARMKAEVSACSQALLSGLGVSNAEKYQNVPLTELLRLRLQEASTSASTVASSSPAQKRPLCNASDNACTSNTCIGNQHDKPNVQKLERRLATEKQRNKNLERRVAELQTKLDGVSADNDNEGNLKAKVSKLADRARTERELRGRAEKEVAKSKEQVEVLTEHIETLMMQLKQQTSAKSAALKELSSASREIDLIKSRSAAMSKRNARKDALINDLRNESSALDSELQTMQAKYGELRLKVDWTRSQTTNTLKKKNEEIHHLQTKLEFLARKDRVLEGMNSSYEQKSKVINTHTGRKTVAIRRGVGFRGGYSP